LNTGAVNDVRPCVGARAHVALGAVLAGLLSGCTSLASGTDHWEKTLEPDPDWDCLNEAPRQIAIPSPAPMFVAYAAPIFDFANPPSRVEGLTVEVCQITDSECPVAKQVGQVVGPMDFQTTLNGATVTVPLYQIVMPFGVEAYLRLNAPGYLRQEYFFGGPLIGTPSSFPTMIGGAPATVITGLPLIMLKAADAGNLASAIGQTRNPGQAIIALRTIDCNGKTAAGVTLQMERAQGLSFSYLANLALTTDPPQPTDGAGLAGFANIPLPNGVPIYNVTVEGRNRYDAPYGLSPFPIRPDQITSGEIRPFPTLYGR
jgi:hypothetical protein